MFQLTIGIFFLLVYHVLLVSPTLESSHAEHEHEDVHSVENELDACHQAIYHGGIDSEHDSHLVEEEDFCSICIHTFSSHISLTHIAEQSQFTAYVKLQSIPETTTNFRFVTGVHNKAPPVV